MIKPNFVIDLIMELPQLFIGKILNFNHQIMVLYYANSKKLWIQKHRNDDIIAVYLL